MRKTPAAQPALFVLDAPLPEPTSTRSPKRADKSAPAHRAASPVKPAAVKPAVVKTPHVLAPVAVIPPVTQRTALEKSGADGHAWKMSGKHAVAYLRCAALASELLATDTRHLAKAAMAVYYDRKGKAFAWQVRFDTERWEEVTGRLG